MLKGWCIVYTLTNFEHFIFYDDFLGLEMQWKLSYHDNLSIIINYNYYPVNIYSKQIVLNYMHVHLIPGNFIPFENVCERLLAFLEVASSILTNVTIIFRLLDKVNHHNNFYVASSFKATGMDHMCIPNPWHFKHGLISLGFKCT